MQVAKTIVISNGIEHYGIEKEIHKSSSVLVIVLCGFQKEISHT
jgi:hypothetical protein